MLLADNLRQMLALLEGERQALSGLDLERILVCAEGKKQLSGSLAAATDNELDEECRGLLEGVAHLNNVNRKLRNMIADGVQTRLDTLTGVTHLYGAR